MIGLVVAAAANGALMAVAEENAFQRGLDSLTPDQRAKAIESRAKYLIDERRHRELCDAIRSTRRGFFG